MSAHKHDIDIEKTAARVLDAVLALEDRGGIPEDEKAVASARERIGAEVAAVVERAAEFSRDPSPAELADRLSDAGWSDAALSLGDDVFQKRRGTAPLAAAVISLAILLVGIIWALTSHAPADAPARGPKVDLIVEAAGIAEGSILPGTLELTGSGEPVSLEFDTDRVSLGELEPGDYAVSLVETPVLEDGTTFVMADEAAFTVGAEDGEREVPIRLDAVKVDELTDESRLGLADRAEKAHAEDLSALLRADGIAENPDEPARPENAPADEPAADPDGDATPQKPADKPQKGDEPSKPAGGQTSSKPSSGSNGGGASKPSHQHAWVHHDAVYKTVHHDAVYNNVWHPPVTVDVTICNACGAENPGRDHMYQHAINGDKGGTHVITKVVKDGYNEQVLVSAAWDEKVLVSNAYDECSCGARR